MSYLRMIMSSSCLGALRYAGAAPTTLISMVCGLYDVLYLPGFASPPCGYLRMRDCYTSYSWALVSAVHICMIPHFRGGVNDYFHIPDLQFW